MKKIIFIFIASIVLCFLSWPKAMWYDTMNGENYDAEYYKVIGNEELFAIKNLYSSNIKIYDKTGTKISSIPLKYKYPRRMVIDKSNKVNLLTVKENSFDIDIYSLNGKLLKQDSFYNNLWKDGEKYPEKFQNIKFRDEGFEVNDRILSLEIKYTNNSKVIVFERTLVERIFESMILPLFFFIIYIGCIVLLLIKSLRFRNFFVYYFTWNLHFGSKEKNF